jgi:hypothetical protein
MKTKLCVQCGKEFSKNPDFSYEKYAKQTHCSKSCALRSRAGEKRPGMMKEKHHMWKGGKIERASGYVIVHKPEHPYCQSHGYILEHRLVMEKHLGRYLHPKEVVHHINEIKNDNRIENLELLKNQSKHMQHHFKQDPITGRLIA